MGILLLLSGIGDYLKVLFPPLLAIAVVVVATRRYSVGDALCFLNGLLFQTLAAVVHAGGGEAKQGGCGILDCVTAQLGMRRGVGVG